MRRLTFICISVSVIALYGCSKEAQEAAETIKNLQSIASSAESVTNSNEQLDKLRKKRQESGDTTSLPSAELLGYLPTELDGYVAADPETESVNVGGLAYSKVTREFTSATKGNVTITLIDYNGAFDAYAASSAFFALNVRVDNNEETSGTFQTDNAFVNGHEKYSKTGHDVTVVYGIAGRFWVEINSTQQTSSAWSRGIGNSMNLSKLASM